MRLSGRCRCRLATLLAAGLLAACGGGGQPAATSAAPTQAQAGSLSQLYAQAKREGPVTFLAPPPLKLLQPVLALFKKTYPGVTIRAQSSGDKPILATVSTQESAGSVQVDLVADAVQYLVPLVPSMLKVNWARFHATPDSVLPHDLGLHWFDSNWVVAYNTRRVKPGAVPHSWNDLLASQWSGGRIAVDNSAGYLDGMQLSPTWGLAKEKAFAAKLAKQKPLIEARPVLVLQALANGQADIGTTLAFLVLKAKAQGQPVDIAPVSPQFTQHVDLFIPKGAKHVAGAELLAAWLTSPKARALFEKASYFGYATPCNASSMSKYLCAKHIKTRFFPTYKDVVTKEIPVDKALDRVFGMKS